MYKIRTLFDIDSFHRRGILGQGICTAILDSGAYIHSDYKKNIVHFVDFINNSKTPYDDHSHGTHICGIIAGGGIINKKYKGMAPRAGIIPVKVLDKSGHCDSDTLISAIHWILDNMGKYNIRIVNISIGTKASSCLEEYSELVNAVDSLWDNGIIVIVSAGNNGPEYRSITIPGISRKVITIGSCRFTGNRSPGENLFFSGKGPTFCNILKPDIVVPGDNIISCSVQNSYTAKSGTSMSTPIVTGAAALTLSYRPELTNTEFKKYLLESSVDIGLDKYTQGHGMLDLNKLFELIS